MAASISSLVLFTVSASSLPTVLANALTVTLSPISLLSVILTVASEPSIAQENVSVIVLAVTLTFPLAVPTDLSCASKIALAISIFVSPILSRVALILISPPSVMSCTLLSLVVPIMLMVSSVEKSIPVLPNRTISPLFAFTAREALSTPLRFIN